jgi:uncharacterized repeat protein (TIGR01451 family)
LTDNLISSNWAHRGAGADFAAVDSVTLTGNTVISNTAWWKNLQGGGLRFVNSTGTTLNSNIITNNSAAGFGGGLYVDNSDTIMTNNIIADNQAAVAGSGLCNVNSYPQLLHTTIARNSGGDGSGVYITGTASTAFLTNTILVSHTVGITVAAGNTVTLEATLWGTDTWANLTDWGGPGAIFTGTTNLWDNPAFVNPDAGDYHIGANSAAMDAGVDVSVTTDIDGDPRPMGHGYDVGADELRIALAVSKQATPNPVAAGAQLTYTLRVTNTGDITLTATITDLLPHHLTTTQTPVWTATIPAPGGIWTEMLVVNVETNYTGTLTNVVQVATAEGATGAYTELSKVKPGGSPPPKYLIYLPLMVRNY